MKNTLTALACAVGIALGLGTTAPAQAAGAAGAMSDARVALGPVLLHGADENLHQANYHKSSDWRNRSRYRNRYSHRRYYRGSGPSIYFHFGTPPRIYAPPRRHTYRLPAAHVRWCYNRYRSYRDWDNTFQPYHGPRRPCISPYG